MHNLVSSIHKKWLDTKRYAANKCRRSFPDMARQLDECSMFTGEESLPELVDLIFTPQGREFMLANNFPSLVNFRKFKPYQPEQYKVYIDCGTIKLNEPERCILIGNTIAEIHCTRTRTTNIVLMHGAKALVYGYNYAVIKVEKDRKSKCDIYTIDHARVL